jgi:hypothetical protein
MAFFFYYTNESRAFHKEQVRALEQCATEAAQAVASGFDVSYGKKTCNSSTVTIYAYRNPILLHFGLFDASCLLPACMASKRVVSPP